jgi:CheY-like chemotaxis protein
MQMIRILVVDDDDSVQGFCRFVLEDAGYSVTVTPDGRSALAAFRVSPFDLVLTDIHMPDKDGIETMLELRREYPLVQVIVMSGGGSYPKMKPVLFKSASLLGAALTLDKPFTADQLLEAVRQVISDI